MSIFNDKSLKSVAEAAAKIMAETSHGSTPKTPKEKSLAALAHPKDKITHKDVLVGRGVLKKEEKEELDEAFPTVADGEKSLKAKEGKTTHGKITKTKTGMKHERDYDDQPEPEVKRGRGRPKKRLSEMRQEYFNYFEEEVDNETFTKELEDQKAKFDGKKKGADVAKPSVQAVKQEEVEQIDELSKKTLGSYIKKANARQTDDYHDAGSMDVEPERRDGIARTEKINRAVDKLVSKKTNEEVELDERTLTKGEAKKKEDYVMGMKKKMAGFKQRYGERAKSVMYATATKMAKKD
jgi:hypothetical protein